MQNRQHNRHMEHYYSISRNNNALVYDVDELFYNVDNRCVVYDVLYVLSTVTKRLCEYDGRKIPYSKENFRLFPLLNFSSTINKIIFCSSTKLEKHIIINKTYLIHLSWHLQKYIWLTHKKVI